ncbi:MAG: 3-methyl-2-oxobutanoate hydroxymethyltransferase [Firmicutes bacterium]|nr:3-methyl-2-oxobutanoate hydroxymethyltransferase [Bacillota bacterium]
MKVNIAALQEMKERGEKITVLTAYDYTMARMADEAGVDLLLVGDSVGTVALGYDSARQVTMDDMLHHVKAVVAAARRSLVVADMPFGSYHVSTEDTLKNALRLLAEGGCRAVKLEGGQEIAPLVSELTRRGIPVMAHIGLRPQTATLWEGRQVQGLDEETALELVNTAQELEEAGAFAIFMESVTAEVARLITEKVDVPTIGCGCGPDCDGQALLFHDALGLTDVQPLYVRQFLEGRDLMEQAVQDYCRQVREKSYPDDEHSYHMDQDEAKRIY